MARTLAERVERFVRLGTVAVVLNVGILVLSVTQIAPRSIGPPDAMLVWGLILNLMLVGAAAGLLRLLRRNPSRP
jgi:hypothetical protein